MGEMVNTKQATMRYHFMPGGLAIIKKTKANKYKQAYRVKGTVGGRVY